VAAKAQHASTNNQVTYAQGSNKSKANHLAAMSPNGRLSMKKKDEKEA